MQRQAIGTHKAAKQIWEVKQGQRRFEALVHSIPMEFWPFDHIDIPWVIGEGSEVRVAKRNLQWFFSVPERFEKPAMRAIELLLSNYPDERLRGKIIVALGSIGGEKAAKLLAIALKNDPVVENNLTALRALEKIGDSRAIPIITRLCGKSRDSQIFFAAHEAIEGIKQKNKKK